MYRTILSISFLLATTGACVAEAQVVRGCLPYEPDTVRLTGRLERHVYFGPPNFGESPATDEREVGLYLGLAKPVCTEVGKDADLNDPQRGIRRVQLVIDSAGYAGLRPYLGRRVTLQGTLIAAQTGRHHTPILLVVSRPVRVQQRR